MLYYLSLALVSSLYVYGVTAQKPAGECYQACNDMKREVLTMAMCRDAKKVLPRPKVGDFCSGAMEQGFKDACFALCQGQTPVPKIAQVPLMSQSIIRVFIYLCIQWCICSLMGMMTLLEWWYSISLNLSAHFSFPLAFPFCLYRNLYLSSPRPLSISLPLFLPVSLSLTIYLSLSLFLSLSLY